jgi:predicted dehydrogenase
MSELDIPDEYIAGLDMDNVFDPFIKQAVGPRLFVDAIVKDKKVTPNFLDGYKAQQVVDAAMKSDKEGCWVDISG